MTAADAWLIAEYKRRYRAKRAVPVGERDESWRTEAACAGRPRDWWFAPSTRDEHDQAAAICAGCPVVDACTEYGARWREYGRWGRWVYLDERDLKTLRRQRLRLEREVAEFEADIDGFETAIGQ